METFPKGPKRGRRKYYRSKTGNFESLCFYGGIIDIWRKQREKIFFFCRILYSGFKQQKMPGIECMHEGRKDKEIFQM